MEMYQMSLVVQKRPFAVISAGVISLAAALAACDSLSNDGARDASLSFKVGPGAATQTATAEVSGPGLIVVTGGGHTVDLKAVHVLFSEVTFEGSNVDVEDDDDSDVDSDSDHPGNTKFRSGNITLPLPLDGGLVTPFAGKLPVGTYRDVEMDADFIRLMGTYDGETFDVSVPVNAELELRFNPPLVVTESSDPINVSVTIDVASWLKDANGSTIDPRQLATNATLRAEFRSRVRASFRAFEDQDRDADESDSDSDSS
jgi:hypothetical protein